MSEGKRLDGNRSFISETQYADPVKQDRKTKQDTGFGHNGAQISAAQYDIDHALHGQVVGRRLTALRM
jgi:hypothetical protein